MESTLIMIFLAVSSLTKAEVGPLNGCTVIDDHTVGGLRHPLNEKKNQTTFQITFRKKGGWGERYYIKKTYVDISDIEVGVQ